MSGVSPATLRIWEARHGFPHPRRGAGGQRRYSRADAERVLRVRALRAEGLSLAAAIARSRTPPPPSLFAALRLRLADTPPMVMRRDAVLAISRAIEDEHCARGAGGLLLGSFQRARYYRRSRGRWQDLARTAALAVALADFRPGAPSAQSGARPGARASDTGTLVGQPVGTGPAVRSADVVELAIERNHPLSREWAVIVSAEGLRACLAAWEPPAQRVAPAARRFEVLWSFEPVVVAEAVAAAAALVRERDAALAARLQLAAAPASMAPDAALQAGSSLAQRIVGYLTDGRR